MPRPSLLASLDYLVTKYHKFSMFDVSALLIELLKWMLLELSMFCGIFVLSVLDVRFYSLVCFIYDIYPIMYCAFSGLCLWVSLVQLPLATEVGEWVVRYVLW